MIRNSPPVCAVKSISVRPAYDPNADRMSFSGFIRPPPFPAQSPDASVPAPQVSSLSHSSPKKHGKRLLRPHFDKLLFRVRQQLPRPRVVDPYLQDVVVFFLQTLLRLERFHIIREGDAHKCVADLLPRLLQNLMQRPGQLFTSRTGGSGICRITGGCPFSPSSTTVTLFSSPASLTEYGNGAPQ